MSDKKASPDFSIHEPIAVRGSPCRFEGRPVPVPALAVVSPRYGATG